MWRAFFLAVGVTLCIWGLQCMVVERAVLVQPSEEGASGALAGFDLPGTSEPRVIEPPEWAPWSLLSAGGIVVLYSLMLKSGGGGG